MRGWEWVPAEEIRPGHIFRAAGSLKEEVLDVSEPYMSAGRVLRSLTLQDGPTTRQFGVLEGKNYLVYTGTREELELEELLG